MFTLNLLWLIFQDLYTILVIKHYLYYVFQTIIWGSFSVLYLGDNSTTSYVSELHNNQYMFLTFPSRPHGKSTKIYFHLLFVKLMGKSALLDALQRATQKDGPLANFNSITLEVSDIPGKPRVFVRWLAPLKGVMISTEFFKTYQNGDRFNTFYSYFGLCLRRRLSSTGSQISMHVSSTVTHLFGGIQHSLKRSSFTVEPVISCHPLGMAEWPLNTKEYKSSPPLIHRVHKIGSSPQCIQVGLWISPPPRLLPPYLCLHNY